MISLKAAEPAVSVVVPCRDEASHLPTLVPRILSDLRWNDELVIVDNGSSDGSLSILGTLSAQHDQLLVLRKGGSLAEALNFAILQAQNPLILRMDADDVWFTSRLRRQAESISPSDSVLFCDYQIRYRSNYQQQVPTALFPPFVATSLISGVRTPHPGAAFWKDAWASAGMYRETELPTEDVGLWLRMAEVGDLRSISDCLLGYSHPGHLPNTEFFARRKRARELICRSGAYKRSLRSAQEQFQTYAEKLLDAPNGSLRLALSVYEYLLALRVVRHESRFKLFRRAQDAPGPMTHHVAELAWFRSHQLTKKMGMRPGR